MTLGHQYEMTELPRHRLIQARTKAGFATPSDAARAHKRTINQNTLISHENGNRAISRKAAEKYGAAFHVDPGWILFGGGAGDDATDDQDDWASWEGKLKEVGQLEVAKAFVRILASGGKVDEPPPSGPVKGASKARKPR